MNYAQFDLKPEVSAYLDRIGFKGTPDRSLSTLEELQECHLHAVPYENLDIVRGTPLSLQLDDLIGKIIHRRRGGYCFELNALFGWLLRELGFEVTDYVARFWRDEPNPPPMRRHHVLRVQADNRDYLCDVGVGGIVPRRPILMEEGLEQQQGEECYRLDRDAEYGWLLTELYHGQWRRIYSFTEERQLPKDFIMASYWCEHSPDSVFRAGPIVAIRTREGRHTLAGQEFRLFTAQGVQTFVPGSQEEYEEALRTYFGLELEP
ncbi:N-hydroxyarylamine O-acetyltransferase [Paenibacillus sp. UNCCL117]|uniref:arylamine N-acetyltransferase family protein n=1 Tax=unclassified Paenibacillus TaxID=185978 RepID=UPI00087E914A|nr:MULTISPECIES: arylamine N-acetyltransferase [unclassified Paenibacillus]SDE25158.1 N-hydroxyarylamine O-acetyltransferase [Paenibacillus sp. cl123]SFW62359.1 N-hydroxyarylamine O-acetyltransferase [Paenibacillus sp. UNCCL117]